MPQPTRSTFATRCWRVARLVVQGDLVVQLAIGGGLAAVLALVALAR